MYIFPNKFVSFIKIDNIKNQQYLANMKAIGLVVMTESAITFPLPGSW